MAVHDSAGQGGGVCPARPGTSGRWDTVQAWAALTLAMPGLPWASPRAALSSQVIQWIWSAPPNLPAGQRKPKAGLCCGAHQGVPRDHEVAHGLPGTAISGPMIICYCIWISPRFRELITTCVWVRGCFEVGGWAGTRQPPACDEGLNTGNLAPGELGECPRGLGPGIL